MKRMLLAVCVAAFAALIGLRVLQLRAIALTTRELPLKHLPNCHLLEHIEYGSEDLTILRDGLAFISTGLKYPRLPYFSDNPGKLFTLDLLDPRMTPVALKIKGNLNLNTFNPHGISVYTDETDESIYLFVVNHPYLNSQVEVFRFVEEDNAIVHLKTVKHELLHSVNDIVAVGVESFYAINDHSFPSEALNLLIIVLGLPWCNVVYYSPHEVKVVAGGIMAANGINMSPDKKYLYVSDIMDHEVDVFDRLKGEDLVYMKSVDVGSLCDSIEVDHETGDLWLGCHPNGAKLARNPVDPKDPPGSEVIRIQDIHSASPKVTQVYVDDGHVLMGSTVAAPYGGKLLIGTVFHKALCCDLK